MIKVFSCVLVYSSISSNSPSVCVQRIRISILGLVSLAFLLSTVLFPLALWFFGSSLMCSLTHRPFLRLLRPCTQTCLPLQMTGDCRKIMAGSVLFSRCPCPSVGAGSFRLRCPACNAPGAVELVWIACQGLLLQMTPNKDFSNKVLVVMWYLSFEAATVYAVLNCYHFIRNWLWTQCFF